jgi:hypothetical protein
MGKTRERDKGTKGIREREKGLRDESTKTKILR